MKPVQAAGRIVDSGNVTADVFILESTRCFKTFQLKMPDAEENKAETGVLSLLHLRKQSGPMAATDEGTEIDSSDEQQANASSASIESLEPDSNVKSERLEQKAKHERGIVSIDEGMQID
jgi:hypothetical protein